MGEREGIVGAHPRVCGEHVRVRSSPLNSPGSSPRLRGAPSSITTTTPGVGLIPASAGSTHGYEHFRVWLWAHPRVCGEHITPGDNDITHLGSSPRLRGAHLLTSTFNKCDEYLGSTVSRSGVQALIFKGSLRAQHECQTVEIGWFPFVPVGPKIEALVIGCAEGHESIAVIHVSAHTIPEPVSYSCAGSADEDAWGYLHQPFGQVTADTLRYCVQYEHEHVSPMLPS